MGSDGEVPSSSNGASYYPSPEGQGIGIWTAGELEYQVEDNIEAEGGMVDMWVQRKWDASDSASHHFFIAGSLNNCGFAISRDGANNLRFISWHDGLSSEVSTGYSTGSWAMDSWHHIQAVWGREGLELYVDDVSVSKNTAGGDYHSPEAFYYPIYIAGNPYNSSHTWSDCVVESVKVYGFEHTFFVEPEESQVFSGLEGGSIYPGIK